MDAFSFSATASSEVWPLGFMWRRLENNPNSSLRASHVCTEEVSVINSCFPEWVAGNACDAAEQPPFMHT